MSTTVDARGLSCPQPVLMTMDEIKKVGKGEILVLVDTDTSKENVSRAAENQGWQVKDIQNEGEGYKVIIKFHPVNEYVKK
jgi:tRNA 2-thiouridine synthesizing protein A